MIGKDELYRYMQDFGFGETTAVDFPNEQPAPSRGPGRTGTARSRGSFPIGQGVSVTPLQMLQAYNTIANGGVYVPPKLVNATVDADGTRHPNVPERQRGPPGHLPGDGEQDEPHAAQRRRGGHRHAGRHHGYTPAGKTGTGRKPHPDGGYTWPDGAMHYQATFVGLRAGRGARAVDHRDHRRAHQGRHLRWRRRRAGVRQDRRDRPAPLRHPAARLRPRRRRGSEGLVPSDRPRHRPSRSPTASAGPLGLGGPGPGARPPARRPRRAPPTPTAAGRRVETGRRRPRRRPTPVYTAENNWGAGGPTTVPPRYGPENNWGAG